MRVFVDLNWFFKKHWRAYASGIAVLAVVSFLSLIPPRVIGEVVDGIADASLTPSALVNAVGLILGIAVVLYILRFLWRLLIFGTSLKLARQIRFDLYRHFTNMPASFYHKRTTGDLMAVSTNDVRAVQATAGEGVLTIVDACLLGGMVVVTMAVSISWQLTFITLLPLPFMALLTSYYGKLLHRRFAGAQAAFSVLNNTVQESIGGMKVTKAFGREQEEVSRFAKTSAHVVEKNMAVARVDALFDPTITIVIGSCYLLAVAVGSLFVADGAMTIGQLTSFFVYLGLLVWPMLAIGMFFNVVERGHASYDRIRAVLNEKSDIVEREQALDLDIQGELDVRIDAFRYSPDGANVLENVHFHLPTGGTLGIVGRTGSGKTTLLSLLQRTIDVTEGDILLDGHSVRAYQLSCIKDAFGLVPQEHFLFSATIAENVAFAKPEASMAEIVAVCKLAQVHEDILRFPAGYDTIVGERGVTLSGGQKQRISIARTLLSDPTLLVLDDALSAVDAKTEEAILQALQTEKRERTIIMTAHRLSAISHASLILVLADGKVSQSGTHAELMQQGGWYKEMYERQQLESAVEQGGNE